MQAPTAGKQRPGRDLPGDRKSSKGDTICIVEAMKCMNEIQSELDGEVTEVLVKDGDLVEYGQPLFRVK